MTAALRRAWLIAAFLAPACIARIASLWQQEVRPAPVDGLGFASDLAIALLLLLAALALRAKWALLLAVAATSMLSLLAYTNFEHIRALNTSLDVYSLKYLGDDTFVRGTMHVSNPWLLVLMLGAPLGLLFAARPLPRGRSFLLSLLAIALLCGAATSALPLRNDIATWRQYNLVHQNMLGLLKRALAKRSADSVLAEAEHRYMPPPGLTAAEADDVEALLRPDLSGEPRLPYPESRPNVLLVILEAVSGAYLDAVADAHNKSVHYDMPHLSAQAEHALTFRNFVSHQRRTNRGEYSILCGDHPNLALKKSKMDYYALERGAQLRCLPTSLSDAGYRTVYLQAAPLGFMFKDRFMTLAGFDEVLGMAWFESTTAWSAWGPDDSAFLSQSLRKVDALRAAGQPWMLTLLTSGTHHPYHTAPGFRGRHEAGSLAQAIEFLDQSLGAFFEALRARGVFEDTLVLVTSDEAEGSRQGGDLARIMSQNWSPMLVFAPAAAAALVDERFGHSDLALSIVDYLGIERDTERFGGRSMFRSYEHPRHTMIGNVYRDRVGMLRPDGRLVLCGTLMQGCRSYAPSTPQLVPELATAVDTDARDLRFLRQFLARNELGRSGSPQDLITLGQPGETVLRSQNTRYIVFGYQYISIPADTDLRVEIELTVSEGAVTFLGDLATDAGATRRFTSQHREVHAGDKLEIAFTYHTSSRFERSEIRLFAENTGGQTAVFDLRRAQLSLRPARRGITGIVKQRVEVRR